MLRSEEILKEKHVPYKVIHLAGKSISVNDVVRNSNGNVNPDEICKTIIVEDNNGNGYAFFIEGDKKIDFSKAKKIVGRKLRIMNSERLLELTGTEPGAVCPFLLDMPLFVDKAIFGKENIHFGSGDHLVGLEIKPDDLNKLVEFEIVDVVKE